MDKLCKYGTHRVIEPKGVLPQPAWKIDNTPKIYKNEILIDVDTLNIDSASFTQIEEQSIKEGKEVSDIILETVSKRGKQHNPVTGSGGMLIGKVADIGEQLSGKIDLKKGDKIATLVSLSLTPLFVERIDSVRSETDQVDIEGKAILFESGIYAKLPDDIDDNLALAVLDVAGAPAQTQRLVKEGDTVIVIGAGGKSGLLCLYEAKKKVGQNGKVIAVEFSDEGIERVKEVGAYDEIIQGDATDPVELLEKVENVLDGEMADLTINCVNIPSTELSSILVTKDRGTIYFFSMATSFTQAALGAEGVGKDIDMIIGNGYAYNHSDIAINILREDQAIRNMFQRIYT
ncbi:L-erythro-3,5-diaminohexanoate dehydrogenase [Proteinivorax hydrogeniformans]|uniref:L-erythro-3,5-diaminohexanoate dehydrogenase n=1 Tax=Proteinivorax hydrogeniformans TaxID=1826727 RepID=A0AAU8HTI8_9FIRM